MHLIYTIAVLALLSCTDIYHAYADTITLRNQQTVTGKIFSAGTDEIHCLLIINDVPITAAIKTADIAFVEYDNGTTLQFTAHEHEIHTANEQQAVPSSIQAPPFEYTDTARWKNVGLKCLLALVISLALFAFFEYTGTALRKIRRNRQHNQRHSNRRIHARRIARMPFTYSTTARKNTAAETVNISLGGLLFLSAETHTSLGHISIQLLPEEGKKILLEAMIIRCEYNHSLQLYAIGVCFVGLTDETRNSLANLLTQLENKLPESCTQKAHTFR